MIEPTQPKWPHLENIDKHPEFLEDAKWITVTEKIHGFNARFGKTLEGPWVGSRNNVAKEGKSLQGFYEWALTRMGDAPAGYTFFGEWAGKNIQKSINYGEKKFFLFGVSKYTEGLADWLDRHSIESWAKLLSCETVPLLYDGPWPSDDVHTADLEYWRRTDSLVAVRTPTDDGPTVGQKTEGICIAAWPPAADKYGNPLILKWKNPAFAELASARRDKKLPADLSNVQPFVDEYATEERLNHVLEQVEEAINDGGAGAEDPRDVQYTGEVLRTYYEDVVREGSDDFEKLSKNDQHLVGKTLNNAVKPMLDALRVKRVLAQHIFDIDHMSMEDD